MLPVTLWCILSHKIKISPSFSDQSNIYSHICLNVNPQLSVHHQKCVSFKTFGGNRLGVGRIPVGSPKAPWMPIVGTAPWGASGVPEHPADNLSRSSVQVKDVSSRREHLPPPPPYYELRGWGTRKVLDFLCPAVDRQFKTRHGVLSGDKSKKKKKHSKVGGEKTRWCNPANALP